MSFQTCMTGTQKGEMLRKVLPSLFFTVKVNGDWSFQAQKKSYPSDSPFYCMRFTGFVLLK